ARSGGAAGASLGLELDRGQLPVAARAQAQGLDRARPVSRGEVLETPIEEEAHGGPRLAREMRGNEPVVAGAELRSEPAARVIGKHAHLVLRELEQRGQLLVHRM